jgi:excisionase family DNA binding protein
MIESANEDSNYLRMVEAVRYCKLSEMTLRRLEDAGRLQFMRPTPRTLLIDRRDLDQFLQSLK